MSADQAFDNLMSRNALAVPVAGPGRSEPPPPPRPVRVPDQPRREKHRQPDSTVRVADLLDEDTADYLPRGGVENSDSVRGKAYTVPTETDLPPVVPAMADDEDLSTAHLHGARILGRDTQRFYVDDRDSTDHGRPAGDDGIAEDAGYGRPDGGYGEYGAELAHLRLERAKRLRRLGYLPLSGMDGFESEARDALAALAALDPDRPSLAVTSARRGEGRTELAVRLALALAKRVGHRVLLADFDVRKPQVAARLGVSSKHFTLADVLRGACALGDALSVSEEDNLYVLPARASERDGDEILDGRQVEGLFAALHRAFDFTIIDCGPVGHADAVILCRLAGFTALAGRCGASSARLVNEAGERLEAAGARIAGVLLTNG